MVKFLFTLVILFFVLPAISQPSVRVEIKTLPAYHTSGDDIYIAGSFNGWNPQDANYRFQQTETGNILSASNLMQVLMNTR
ncbi:MAG: hypothetical protein WDO71_06140 [Bacteroidota bacterium]